MALDLVKDFKKHERKIFDYIDSRIRSYNDSKCKSKLKNRIERMGNSLDMRFNNQRDRSRATNAWLSKVAFPLCRESYMNLAATLKANFSGTPLFSLQPVGGSPLQNATNASNVLESNLKTTKFRSTAFDIGRKWAARSGVAVFVSRYTFDEVNEKKTTETQLGIQQMIFTKRKNNIVNYCIHPLNYFQNQNISDPKESDYRGYTEREFLSDVIARMQTSKFYIKENCMDIINKAKRSAIDSGHYYEGKTVDYKGHFIDTDFWWGTVNIVGNEDDDTVYYIEKIGDKIVRFGTNPNDLDLVPIIIATLDKRLDWWHGNTYVENVLPHENYMNLILSMSADNALRALENYIFYDAGSVDIGDLNNRFKNGGLVPFNAGAKSARDLFFGYQRPEASFSGTQYMLQEVKESAQRVTPKVDLQRKSLQGGIQNKTLGAAEMVEEQTNLLQADFLSEFSYGLCDLAEANIVLMQQYFPDNFKVPLAQGAQVELYKGEMLGEFEYEIQSSLTTNKQSEALRLQNAITALENFRGTGDPVMQNTAEIVVKTFREWIRKLDLPGVDLDRDFPEAQVMPQQPPQMAMAPAEMAVAA